MVATNGLNILSQAAYASSDASDDSASGIVQGRTSIASEAGPRSYVSESTSTSSMNNSETNSAASYQSILYANFRSAMNDDNEHQTSPLQTSLQTSLQKRDSNASLPPKKRFRHSFDVTSVSTLGSCCASTKPSNCENYITGRCIDPPSMKHNEEWGVISSVSSNINTNGFGYPADSATVVTASSAGSTTSAYASSCTMKNKNECNRHQLYNNLIVPKKRKMFMSHNGFSTSSMSKHKLSSHNNSVGDYTTKAYNIIKKERQPSSSANCKDLNGNEFCMGYFSSMSSSPSTQIIKKSSHHSHSQPKEIMSVSTKASSAEAAESEDKFRKLNDEKSKLLLRKAYLQALNGNPEEQ